MSVLRCSCVASALVLSTLHRLPAPISEIPESPTPAPTAAPALSVTAFSVGVVEEFVKSLSFNNADSQLQFYAGEVSYYELGRVTKDSIRKDLEHDIRTWPTRVYAINYAPKITQLSSGTFQAEFPMTYMLTNNKGLSSGILEMTVRFQSEGATWQVFEIKKKPIVAQKNR